MSEWTDALNDGQLDYTCQSATINYVPRSSYRSLRFDADNGAEMSGPAEGLASAKLRAVPLPCPGNSGLRSSAAPEHAPVPAVRPPASGSSKAELSPTCPNSVKQKPIIAPMSEEACSKADRPSIPTPLATQSPGPQPAPVQQQQQQQQQKVDNEQLGSCTGISIPIIAVPIETLGQTGQRVTSSKSSAPACPATDSGAAIPRHLPHGGTSHTSLPVVDDQQTARGSLAVEVAGTMLAIDSLTTVVDVLALHTSSMPLSGT